MTQEDKDLILKDLGARLSYKVVAQVSYKDGEGWKTEDRKILGVYTDEQVYVDSVYTIKPYLRPMSSMTKEEKEELRQEQIKDEQLFADCIKNHPEMRGLIIPHFAADWCDKNMFDYRGLIPKGLAIPVTEKNNPYKK